MLIRKIVINILQEQEIKKITRKKEEKDNCDSLVLENILSTRRRT